MYPQTETNNYKIRPVASIVGNQNNSDNELSMKLSENKTKNINIDDYIKKSNDEFLQLQKANKLTIQMYKNIKTDRNNIPNFLQVWNKNQNNLPTHDKNSNNISNKSTI